MSSVVALGDGHEVAVLALAGVRCIAAPTGDEVVAAWRALDTDVGLVILTPAAGRTLAAELDARPDVLTVVIPS